MKERKHYNFDDSELLARLRQGDEEAFSALFYTYKDKLYDFILGLTRSEHEAEDGVQDVFMKIWQNRSRLADVDNLNAYLYGIARHQIIDAVRQFARNIAAIDSLLDEQKEHTVSTPIEDVLSKEMNDALDEAIAQLSPPTTPCLRDAQASGEVTNGDWRSTACLYSYRHGLYQRCRKERPLLSPLTLPRTVFHHPFVLYR
jgi:RNA polymerase sigma-70 factor (ECF subfamily)